MGQDPKEKLKSPDPLVANTQEVEAMIERSKRLIEELQELINTGKQLVADQRALREQRKKRLQK